MQLRKRCRQCSCVRDSMLSITHVLVKSPTLAIGSKSCHLLQTWIEQNHVLFTRTNIEWSITQITMTCFKSIAFLNVLQLTLYRYHVFLVFLRMALLHVCLCVYIMVDCLPNHGIACYAFWDIFVISICV
jgi:hypothetical protein